MCATVAVVSPKSRGRRTKGSPKRRGTRSSTEHRETDLLFAQMVRDVGRDLLDLADPLQAELCVSDLLGLWWNQVMVDADPEVVFGEGVVGHAARKRTTGALALLRCVSVLGAPHLRTMAAAAADAMAADGVADPPWAQRLGACAPTWSLAYGDVFGDQTSVLVAFERDGRSHGLVVLVDHTLGGLAKDAFVTDDPQAVRSQIQALSEPTTWLREVSAEQARSLLEPAFAVTDSMLDPPLGEDFRSTRALALARIRVLPRSADSPAEPAEFSPAERDAIVAEFLAATQARRLPDTTVARECARLIVDYGCDYDAGQPLRVSPAKTEVFLMDWLPRTVVLTAAQQESMPAAVRAWASWAGRRTGLPKAAMAELREAVDELTAAYPEIIGSAEQGPAAALIADLVDGELDLGALQVAVERRLFAMPFFGTRIGDEDFPGLDPSDPDERGILILGEHPEYHEAIDDPAFDGTVDGVNPRLHLAAHEIVAEQLWHDDPAEAWSAAQRLTATGMDRHNVLHALADVAMRQLYGALTNREAVDVDAYRADLAALGADRPARRARPAAKGQDGLFDEPARRLRAAESHPAGGSATAAAYQVKVSLRDVKPPIWRRLVLPAAVTLAELHDVVQVAMGWTDSHLHQFATRSRVFGPSHDDADPGQADETDVRLDGVLHRPGDQLRYRYDFGDGWEHDIVLEQVQPVAGPVPVTCLAGRRACPPEDCGGPWGYTDLCAALSDPAHPRHAELTEWVGGYLAPAHFDRAEVNRQLAAFDR